MGKGEKEENKLNKKPKPVPLSPKLQRIKRSLPLLSYFIYFIVFQDLFLFTKYSKKIHMFLLWNCFYSILSYQNDCQ